MHSTAALGVWQAVIMLLLGGGSGIPLGVPPAPEDPLLARVAPEECLYYASWAGIAEPDPTSENATEQLLAEPEVQHLIQEVERLATAMLLLGAEQGGGPPAQEIAKDLVFWGKKLLTHPAAMFLESVEIQPDEPGPPKVRAAVIAKLGSDVGKLKSLLEEWQQEFLGPAVEPVEIGSDTWHRITLAPNMPPITWGVKSKYLIVGAGNGTIERLIDRVTGEPPAWLKQIGQQFPVPRRSTVSYINFEAIVKLVTPLFDSPVREEVPQVLKALGLDQVSSLASVTGLDETGFVHRWIIALKGEPRGILGLLASHPLSPTDLDPIPRDATVAFAARADLEEVLAKSLALFPESRQDIQREMRQTQEIFGIDLQNDLLAPLGDTWCLYNSPSEGGLVLTGLTAVVTVDDQAKLARTQTKLLGRFREFTQNSGGRGPRIDQFEFAGRDVYVVDVGQQGFPLAPSWCLTENALVVALLPQNVKAYLSRGDDHESLAEVAEVARLFESKDRPVILSYYDTRSMFELIYPLAPMFSQMVLRETLRGIPEGLDVNVSMLPSTKAIGKHLRPSVGAARHTEAGIELVAHQTFPRGDPAILAPVFGAMLLPAIQGAQGASKKVQSMNHMRHMGVAIHNYASTRAHLPPGYSTDDEGNPLLSWRVHILPFLEESPLYVRFHLDEPWDSEHNKTLIAQMPEMLRSPKSKAEPGMTNYLGVAGEKGLFPGAKKIDFHDIRDGTSNTIMIVEANDERAVIWTKPDDFVPDADNPKAGLLGLWPGGFHVGMADGSVRFLEGRIDDDTLRALFTRNGGEAVDIPNAYDRSSRRRSRPDLDDDAKEDAEADSESDATAVEER